MGIGLEDGENCGSVCPTILRIRKKKLDAGKRIGWAGKVEISTTKGGRPWDKKGRSILEQQNEKSTMGKKSHRARDCSRVCGRGPSASKNKGKIQKARETSERKVRRQGIGKADMTRQDPPKEI